MIIFQARFYATQLRPSSAPIKRIISLMDQHEPIFGKTDQLSDPQLKDVYPHKVSYNLCPFNSSICRKSLRIRNDI